MNLWARYLQYVLILQKTMQLRHLSKGSVVVKLCCVGADDYEDKVAMRGGDEYKMVAEGSGRTQRRR